MSEYFDDFFFASNLTGYVCPGFGSFQCQPPSACARDPNTGKEYCCDYGDVCWTITSTCQSDGSTTNCGGGEESWCCLDKTEICTGSTNQVNICWNKAHDPLLNISVPVLNETYLSLSSASPSASSWTFDPATIIAATQTTSRTTSTSTPTPTSSSSTSTSTSSTTTSPTSSITSTTASPENGTSHSPLLFIILLVFGILLLVALASGLYCFCKRRRRRKNSPLLEAPLYEVDGGAGTNKQTQPGWMPVPQGLRAGDPTSELSASLDHLPPQELPANPPSGQYRYQ